MKPYVLDLVFRLNERKTLSHVIQPISIEVKLRNIDE
jgi:hypothetical protein